MSTALVTLTALVAAIAMLGLIRPAMLFEFPVAACLMMCSFILPQAWLIEQTGDLDDYPLTAVWIYIIMCVAAMFLGFKAGTIRKIKTTGGIEQFRTDYTVGKLVLGALALAVVGGVAIILMVRMAATMKAGEAWGGVIAFYALLSGLMWYATGLSWILYLYTKERLAMIIAFVGFWLTAGSVLFNARREPAFALAATFLLGLYFVKKKSISRLVLIPGLIVGSLLINNAGAIRGYIARTDTTVIGALRDNDVVEKKGNYVELAGGVSDITIAMYTDQYLFLAPYYNNLINLYVPAFILGRDVKDGLMLNVAVDSTISGHRLEFAGATRTGFADTFYALHYFGCLIFFAISYFMGVLWKGAKNGDIKSQVYYMMFLPSGLRGVTDASSIFISVMPLAFGCLGLVFWFARKRKTAATGVAGARHDGAEIALPLRASADVSTER